MNIVTRNVPRHPKGTLHCIYRGEGRRELFHFYHSKITSVEESKQILVLYPDLVFTSTSVSMEPVTLEKAKSTLLKS